VIFSFIGTITCAVLVAGYFYFARRTFLGTLSLPCVSLLVAVVYFFLMPWVTIEYGDPVFFGSVLDDLRWMHFGVLLYALGLMAAARITENYLQADAARTHTVEPESNIYTFYLLLAISFVGAITLAFLGQLNISASSDYDLSEAATVYRFLNYSFTMMISLSIFAAARYNFNILTLILSVIVALILIQAGFRYRLLLLMFGLCVSFLLCREIRIRASWTVVGTICAIFLSNLMGIGRVYGNGIQTSRWEDLTFSDVMRSFGGEIGPIYVFKDFAANELPKLIYLEPWTVGVSRLIPSFLWPDKPDAEYLRLIPYWFSDPAAATAGVAAPQHVEMLLQFGWMGIPFLAFLYFCAAGIIQHRLQRLSRPARIAGVALIPAFFGYYMQTRGYFFQVLSDSIFLFGPLFLCHYPVTTPAKRSYRRAAYFISR